MNRIGIVTIAMFFIGAVLTYSFFRQAAVPDRQMTGIATHVVTLPVEGMSCASCVTSIKKSLGSMNGVNRVDVDLQLRQAKVVYQAEKVSPKQIAAAINKLGYKAGPAKVEAAR